MAHIEHIEHIEAIPYSKGMSYKILVSLPDDWEETLKERAWKEHQSVAEFLRRIIGEALGTPKAKSIPQKAVRVPQRVDAVSGRGPAVSLPSTPTGSPIIAGKAKAKR